MRLERRTSHHHGRHASASISVAAASEAATAQGHSPESLAAAAGVAPATMLLARTYSGPAGNDSLNVVPAARKLAQRTAVLHRLSYDGNSVRGWRGI